MLAKAIYDGVVVDLPLAGFFMSKILGKYLQIYCYLYLYFDVDRYNFFHELSTMDTELYKNLLFVKVPRLVLAIKNTLTIHFSITMATWKIYL